MRSSGLQNSKIGAISFWYEGPYCNPYHEKKIGTFLTSRSQMGTENEEIYDHTLPLLQ